MKSAFEQVYGPPYLARLLFAEVGPKPAEDLFLRVEYDGAIATNGAAVSQARQDFAVLSATTQSAELMESFLRKEYSPGAAFRDVITIALDAWSVGHMTAGEDGVKELPEHPAIIKHRQEQLAEAGVEAAVLERDSKTAIRYRALSDEEVRAAVRE
jgi:hypothetical protein